MAMFAIVLFVASALFSIGAFADADDVRHRAAWRVLAAGSFLVSISLCLLVNAAQRATCDVLGGRWIAETEACRDEWGGNGNNDPGNPTFIIVG